MPNVNGTGTTWNLPNYAGELFTADPTQTPFLSMIGGLTGGEKTDNFEYVNKLMTHSWGQRVVRFYDPDGNLIEVGTPMG